MGYELASSEYYRAELAFARKLKVHLEIISALKGKIDYHEAAASKLKKELEKEKKAAWR